MPRRHEMNGRASASEVAPPKRARDLPPSVHTFRERLGALRNLPPFLRLVWQTSRPLTVATLLLRTVRALLPVATLYVGKLIIDEVLHLARLGGPTRTFTEWMASGLLHR